MEDKDVKRGMKVIYGTNKAEVIRIGEVGILIETTDGQKYWTVAGDLKEDDSKS